MKDSDFKYLSPEQREHFLEHGWVKVENGVPEESLRRFSEDVWIRLGFDPEDKSTWTKEKIHMPAHRLMPLKEFMPKGYGAIAEVVGGEDRIDPETFGQTGDALIVNLGDGKNPEKDIDPRMTGDWHIDGDWFRHYLDSGDQAVTVIVLFNDIIPRAGGTLIAPDGIKHVAKWFYEHPEGADTWPKDETGARTICNIHECKEFVEVTGKRGDVFILHAFMPHSKSKNYLQVPRYITNPPVTLKGPLNLNRENSDDYSLTELKILRELGVKSLPDWRITGERKRFKPFTSDWRASLIKEELGRMKAHALKTGGVVDSIHAREEAKTVDESSAFR